MSRDRVASKGLSDQRRVGRNDLVGAPEPGRDAGEQRVHLAQTGGRVAQARLADEGGEGEQTTRAQGALHLAEDVLQVDEAVQRAARPDAVVRARRQRHEVEVALDQVDAIRERARGGRGPARGRRGSGRRRRAARCRRLRARRSRSVPRRHRARRRGGTVPVPPGRRSSVRSGSPVWARLRMRVATGWFTLKNSANRDTAPIAPARGRAAADRPGSWRAHGARRRASRAAGAGATPRRCSRHARGRPCAQRSRRGRMPLQPWLALEQASPSRQTPPGEDAVRVLELQVGAAHRLDVRQGPLEGVLEGHRRIPELPGRVFGRHQGRSPARRGRAGDSPARSAHHSSRR